MKGFGFKDLGFRVGFAGCSQVLIGSIRALSKKQLKNPISMVL